DMAYGVVQLGGNFELGTFLDAGWMGFYLFWGLAALHPTVRSVAHATESPDVVASRTRLTVLGAVVLVPPAVMVVQVARGEFRELLVPAGSSVVIVLLVMARMYGLLGSLSATAARERALRTAAASLVATTDRRSVYRATVEATRELLGPSSAVVRLALWSDAELASATSRPGAAGDGTPTPPRASGNGNGHRSPSPAPAGDEPLGLADLGRILEDPLGLGRPARSTVVAPVVIHDDLQGAIVVASEERLPPGLSGTLDTLGSQVAMALESVSLTENLHQRRGEARLAALVQNSSDVITVIDADTTVRYQTPSVLQVLGHSVGDLDGTRLIDLVHPSDLARALVFFEEAAAGSGTSAPVELRTRRADGQWQDVEAVSNNLLGDRNVGGIVLTIRDVSERKAFERRLTEQAFHDALTGLANRSLFSNRLEHALGRRHRRPDAVAVIFIDLDDFKTVNDSLGHAAGDALLVEVAQRLTTVLRPGDTTARLGGDEFAVMIDEIDDPTIPVSVAERVLEQLRSPFLLDGKEVDVSASLGIAVATDGATTAEDLLRNADIAMYMAKSRTQGGYEVFEARMHDSALQRLNLKADLQRALEHDELVLHYQPIYDLATGRPAGFEALVRWQHPERGLLGPGEFIPLAEESGLIVSLGRRVLEMACRQARRWYAVHGATMSVNLSRKQLTHPALVEDVAAILACAGLPPEAVTLEITESLVMHDVDATVAVLHQLRRLGVRIAIDDFGTGYSSLATLRHLPVDVLKIDKAFVDGIATSQEDLILVSTVVELARGLGMATVAEGIEDEAQLAALKAVGCSHGQGYHLSRPVPAAQADAVIARTPTRTPDRTGEPTGARTGGPT
ncbi:MAG TPA: EAL domain-containing protein, partial [Acidimicrobiales bacterium]|nr:EAL domain-containing protein [Acidimicrobiales bacterium]